MRILINRSDVIGDAILTMPMAKMLKEHFPHCHITFLVSTRSADLFLNHPHVDDFRIYNRKDSFFKKAKILFQLFKELHPTHYFYVGGGHMPDFISWLYRLPFRGGIKSRWQTFLFLNQGVRQKRSMVSMHEFEFNLNLLAPLGIQYHHKDAMHFTPQINLLETEIAKTILDFNEELKKAGFSAEKELIVIHPGMSGHTLNWSSKNYGRFIVKMSQRFPDRFNYIVSHTPSDLPFLHGLKEILSRDEGTKVSQQVYFFNGQKKGLRYFSALLTKAKLFLGPSTGTTHIAAILGIPVVTIYSPIKVQSALRWGPRPQKTDKLKILVPDVICGETHTCALRDCPYYECMAKIEVEDVIKQALTIMDL